MFNLRTNALRVMSLALLPAILPAYSAAQDASCARYIELTAKMPDRPYRAIQTMTVAGEKMENEAIFVDGVIYTKQGNSKTGKWMATPLPDLKETIAMAKKTTSKCSVGGTEIVNGVPTQVWTSHATTPFDPKASQWKTWIGVADGRVYRQASEGFDQRYVYGNVSAPPASEIAQPRKRK